MSDDDAEFQRLIVRSVRRSDVALMADAARRAEKGQGEWLGEAIRAYVAAERADGLHGEVLAPGALPVMLAAPLPALSIEEIGRAVEIAARIAELRGRPTQTRVLVRAQRLLSARLARPPRPDRGASSPP